MDHKQDRYNYDCLAFFGKVNASISHELKNIMAIISETAGLLSDLSEMSKEGAPIDADMLKSSTESIVEEIQRGFLTIRQMNHFSHSVDTPDAPVNLLDVLDLVRNLSGYLSFSGKMHIHRAAGVTPIVVSCPFILQAIVYQAVSRTFQYSGTDAKLKVSIQSLDVPTWQIVFDGFRIEEGKLFPDGLMKRMAASIGVSIHLDRASDCLKIGVPFSIEGTASRYGLRQIQPGAE
jgi:light-regulated signal transduction histidine kinase (bacteriophytochrome)